jgi:hypothetical protein
MYRAEPMRDAMSDQTSNRNDVASRKLHIPEEVVAVIFGLIPVIVFYLLTMN